MPKKRSELEVAAGRLVSAIQKEWTAEIGEDSARESEAIVHRSHGLLQAAKAQTLGKLLGERTVAHYVGESWLKRHPRVLAAVRELQILVKGAHAV